MSVGAHPARGQSARRARPLRWWAALAALVAVAAILAMHGLAPHNATMPMVKAGGSMTMPMADAHETDHPASSPDHNAPSPSPSHELVALCAVIVLVAAAGLVRATTTAQYSLRPTIRFQPGRFEPDPPVPRLRPAFT